MGNGCSAVTELATQDGIWCQDGTVGQGDGCLRECTDYLFRLEERRWSVGHRWNGQLGVVVHNKVFSYLVSVGYAR